MPSHLRCPSCQAHLRLPNTKPEGPLLCPRCRSEVPLPNVQVTAQPGPPAETSVPPGPVPQADVARCPWCGAALAEQCHFCPNCERALGSGPEGTWQERLGEELRGEYSEASPRVKGVAVLGGFYVAGLVGAGVVYLLSVTVPGFSGFLGFILFLGLMVGLAGLLWCLLAAEPNQPSRLPPKVRRGLFLVLVLGGFVCTLLLVSVLALCGFFFTACTCTGGRILH